MAFLDVEEITQTVSYFVSIYILHQQFVTCAFPQSVSDAASYNVVQSLSFLCSKSHSRSIFSL